MKNKISPELLEQSKNLRAIPENSEEYKQAVKRARDYLEGKE